MNTEVKQWLDDAEVKQEAYKVLKPKVLASVDCLNINTLNGSLKAHINNKRKTGENKNIKNILELWP